MNHAKAIEISVAKVIREFGNLAEGVTIRAWQTLDTDAPWDEAQDRTFPVVEVRASPPRTDDTQATFQIACAVLVGTNAEDDRSHAVISDLYSSVQSVLDALFAQFRNGTDGDELERFRELMTENTVDGTFEFGGFTFGDSLAPYEDAGANMIGQTLTVHYSRSDF